MDCFNYNCPFYNKTSSRCECITCPNRCEAYTTTVVHGKWKRYGKILANVQNAKR